MDLKNGPGLLQLFGVGAQLAVVLLLVRILQIEPASGLPRLLPLIFGGFLINALLPLRYRHAFFLMLSFAAIVIVLGPALGASLAVAGLVLFGIAHLPIAFSARVVLLVIVASFLAAMRVGWTPGFLGAVPLHDALPKFVLPALASMFMFRMMIYMYDLRHEERARAGTGLQRGMPASLWERLSYFFMLPNVCFLLFPLIDYRTFRRTYYDRDAVRIYQQGVWWMCLGLVHLLLYRLVYHYLVPAPDELHGLAGVARFLIASYLIYFRVLGQFHFIAGTLCLFGFDVPPAHRLLFLASSFTDFWRRARIEWKDFMVKVFYYPAVVPLQRKWGATISMVLATVFVFVATWMLHAYQWFWLRGEVRLSSADGVFWTVFGSCVLVNMLLEARGKRQRSTKAWTLGSSLVHSLKVLGMFVFLCGLWSFWSSPSFGVWWSIISAARDSTPDAYVVLIAGLATVLVIGSLVQLGTARLNAARPANQPGWPMPGWRPLAIGTVAIVLLLIGVPASRGTLGAGTQKVAIELRSNRLNQADQERNDRGYYETLLDEPRTTGFLANGDAHADGGQVKASNDDTTAGGHGRVQRVGPLVGQAFIKQTGDVLGYELKHSFNGFYKDAPFTTNRWGMHDKDYELVPPVHTYRIALLGSSYTMAGGVSIDESVEGRVEARLNREGPGAPRRKYEILNFSVGGYGILQNVAVAERKVFQFKPDAVLVMIHNESGRMAIYLINLLKEHVPIEYPYVRDRIRDAGITDDMQQPEMRRRLMPIADDLVRWSYARIAELGKQHGIPVVGVIFPAPVEENDWGLQTAAGLAAEAGITVITLQGAYEGHDLASLRLVEGDVHLNAAGHKLAADKLFNVLRANDARALKLGFQK